MKPERQLRLFQIICTLFLVVCFFVSGLERRETQGAMTLTQWLIVLAAIYSAVSGFTLQRRILRVRNQSMRSTRRSTPFSRWKLGNILRLACPISAGLWALVLQLQGGPNWLVNVLFGIGMVLLLIWRPGAAPGQTES